MGDLIAAITIMVVLVVSPLLLITYSSQMHMDKDALTATNGIIFHSTIELDNYDRLGTATALWCSDGAIIYTRSINHESFKVCK